MDEALQCRSAADEIVRLVEINRKTINGIEHGVIVFRLYRGQPAQIEAATTLTLKAGKLLCPLLLKDELPE